MVSHAFTLQRNKWGKKAQPASVSDWMYHTKVNTVVFLSQILFSQTFYFHDIWNLNLTYFQIYWRLGVCIVCRQYDIGFCWKEACPLVRSNSIQSNFIYTFMLYFQCAKTKSDKLIHSSYGFFGSFHLLLSPLFGINEVGDTETENEKFQQH